MKITTFTVFRIGLLINFSTRVKYNDCLLNRTCIDHQDFFTDYQIMKHGEITFT